MRDAGPIMFNGKFLSADSSGVHRVAREMIRGIGDILVEDEAFFGDRPVVVVAPRNIREPMSASPVSVVVMGWLTGQLWEQVSLPLFSRRGLLVSLCNLTPVFRPSVIMIHDAQVHVAPESYSLPFRLFYRITQPWMARRARLVLTVSHYSKDMLIRHGVAKAGKIAVIYNGVDHILRAPAQGDTLGRLGLKPGGYVLGLANTQQHKNIGVLLKAFARPELEHVALVLAGSAKAADFEAHGHVCPKNVVFAGKVSDGQLRALMEGAACLAFPSTTEGFGLPPLEAMLLGCPAVVAPCGALPEVCGDAAIYVEPHDPPAWAAALAKITRDPELRAAYAERGRVHAARFTWAKSARELAVLIDGLEQSAPKEASGRFFEKKAPQKTSVT